MCKTKQATTLDAMYAAIENGTHRKPNHRKMIKEDGSPLAMEFYRHPGQEGNRHYSLMPRPAKDYDDQGNYRELVRTMAYQEAHENPFSKNYSPAGPVHMEPYIEPSTGLISDGYAEPFLEPSVMGSTFAFNGPRGAYNYP